MATSTPVRLPGEPREDGHYAQVVQDDTGRWRAIERGSGNKAVARSPDFVTKRRAVDWAKERRLPFVALSSVDLGPEATSDGALDAKTRSVVGRRFHAFCIGMPKTGTSSVAELFAETHRVAHELDGPRLGRLLTARLKGQDRGELDAYLLERDSRWSLEMDSSPPLGLAADLLVERFADAKYVLTVRQPSDWLRSRANHILQRSGRDGAWEQARFGVRGASSFFASKALEAAGGYSIEGMLSYWVHHNELCLRSIPPGRLLVIETQSIAESLPRLESFLGVEKGLLDAEAAHANATDEWTPSAECLVDPHVREMARRMCGALWEELQSLASKV